MENCVFKEICTQDNTPFRLYLTVSNNSLNAVLLQKENAWNSIIKKKSLQPLATEHQLSLDDYCTKLLEYIKNGNSDIAFIFNNNQFTINRVLKESLMVKYFTCTVEKVDYVNHVEQIMDQLYSENLKTSEQLAALKTENDELLQNKSHSESKLNELIEKKVADESEQFGQFILILNEKKRRIQHLTELLEAFKNGRPTVNPQVVPTKSRKRNVTNPAPVRKLETISESEDSDSGDSIKTDESVEDNNPVPCQASTSTETFDFLEDNFTQPHTLPKRMKIAKSEDDVVVAPPSKSPPKTEEPEVAAQSKSADIDLSTQQLLDMF